VFCTLQEWLCNRWMSLRDDWDSVFSLSVLPSVCAPRNCANVIFYKLWTNFTKIWYNRDKYTNWLDFDLKRSKVKVTTRINRVNKVEACSLMTHRRVLCLVNNKHRMSCEAELGQKCPITKLFRRRFWHVN